MRPPTGKAARTVIGGLASAAVLASGLVAATATAASAATTSARAAAMPLMTALVPGQRQRIMVTASSYGSTYATLTAWQLSGSSSTNWVRVMGPWTARVGYNGIARPGAKREGDGKTPSGSYAFSFMFGVLPNPGVRYSYRHAYTYDYWDDDSGSSRYNEWVDARQAWPGHSPEPMHNQPAYDYAAVIAYNMARTPGRGSAIFFHVGTGGPTAGCVSLPMSELVRVLRWMNPADRPAITISA